MSKIALGENQNRLKFLAENIVSQDKITRQNTLIEMTKINQQLSEAQQIDVIQSINMPPAIKFLSASGIRGDARIVLFARMAALEKEVQ
jgi:hypothetical protein